MYAATTPGTWADVNAERICVAPVARTVPGVTPGAVEASVEINLFAKADCAAERQNDPPIIWKTEYMVIDRSLMDRPGRGILTENHGGDR